MDRLLPELSGRSVYQAIDDGRAAARPRTIEGVAALGLAVTIP